MARQQITIPIEPKFEVSEETAKFCLWLIQCYVNSTGVDVMGNRKPNGELEFYFRDPRNSQQKPKGDEENGN